jgi:hypothetical protein
MRLIDHAIRGFGRTGSLCGRSRRPLDTYAAEQSAARTKSICSLPSQIALVYRIAATRHPEGKRPSRITLRADHKLSSDHPRPSDRHRSMWGLNPICARNIAFGFVAEHYSARVRFRAPSCREGSYRTAMGYRSGRLDLDQSLQVALPRPT